MNIFNDSKYTKWYMSIVTRAQTRAIPEQGYYEKHHIIPRSMGGNNSKDNIVSLTAREHFVCHRLLTKMVEGLHLMKAWAGLRAMAYLDPHGERLESIKITSRLFEELRRRHAKYVGVLVKARWQDPEYRKLMLNSRTTAQRSASALKASTPEVNERKRVSAIGRLHSETTKAKMAETRRQIFATNQKYRDECKARLKASATGRVVKAETKTKISESGKNRVGFHWVLRAPSGVTHTTQRLIAFCAENHLHYDSLLRTLKTKLPVPERIRNRQKVISPHRSNSTGWMIISKT